MFRGTYSYLVTTGITGTDVHGELHPHCLSIGGTSNAIVVEEGSVRNLSLATPYIDEINKLEIDFLESHGFTVVESAGLGIVENIEIGSQTPDVSFRLAKRVVTERTEALLSVARISERSRIFVCLRRISESR